MPLHYNNEQGWFQSWSKTPIHYSEEAIILDSPGFVWPQWAVKMVNEGIDIKLVSSILEKERKKECSQSLIG